MGDWYTNYDGLIIDFKDITEGVLDYHDGRRIYFRKINDDNWQTVSFSKVDMDDFYIVDQINLVHAKTGTKKVNKYFMELLSQTFPEKTSILTHSEMLYIFQSYTVSLAKKIKYESEKYRYISEPNAVIVNGERYFEGQTVYFGGHKYVVKKDNNGNGYLDLAEYPQGKGFIVTEEQTVTKEVAHNIEYEFGQVTSQFGGSEVFFDYTNGQYDPTEGSTIVKGGSAVERRIRAPKTSDVKYWECVDFVPGVRTEVVKKGSAKTLPEGVLSSKGQSATPTPSPPPSQPSGDYGEWLINAGGSNFSGAKKGKSRWVRLKDETIFRISDRIVGDAYWYRNTGNGFEEIIVTNFFDKKSDNYKKAYKIYRKNGGNWLTNAFFSDLKAAFPHKTITFQQFVNKYKGYDWLKPPKNWSNAPHLPANPTPPQPSEPKSGTKTKFFGRFNITSGVFKVTVRYNTFLWHKIGKDTISRGRAKLELIKYLDSGYTTIETLFNVDYNVGNYWDRSTDKYVTKEYKGKGSYGFKLTLIDTYQDVQTIYVRAQPTVTEYTTSSSKGEYDKDASLTFFIIDPKSGKRIPYEGKNSIVLKGAQDVIIKCFSVTIPKGEERVIRYEVKKGNINTGGILGDGTAARLRDGVIKYNVIEKIPPLIITTDESVGRVIGVPKPGWLDPSEKEQDGEVGEKQNPFFWADLITIEGYDEQPIPNDVYEEMLKSVSCYPEGIDVKLELTPYNYDGTFKDWDPMELVRKEYIFHEVNARAEGFFKDDNIELRIENPFNEPIQITTEFKMVDNDDCGGGGFINFSNVGWEFWGDGDLIGDGIERLPTYVKIAIKELVSNHEIIGGCPGCYAEVLVKDGNKVLKTIRIDENGWTDFNVGNLYDYGLNEFDIEIKTYQEGYVDPRGYDVRCMFILDSFGMFVQYELGASNFDSMLDFYINDDKKFSIDQEGAGVHYFPVRKGKNKYKFVFSTNNWDYNWDYAEIPWVRLTNWICDDIPVVPYCEAGRGDKCIEALIGCVLGLLPKKRGCVIVKHIDYETGEVIKQEKYRGYTRGEYVFNALDLLDFEVVGESSKKVFVEEVEKCSEVEFYYRRLYRDCVWVIHEDITTGNVILKETYPNLIPGEYTFGPKIFPDYTVVGGTEKTIILEYLHAPPEECKKIVFKYNPIKEKDPYFDCVWVIHREKDNPNNILAVDHHYNLVPGKYKYTARNFAGYEVVGDTEKEVIITEIIDPITECKKVIFEYRKIKKGCVIVKFIDKVNNVVLDTDYYYELLPGEYSFNAKEFEGYELVDDKVKTILITEDDGKCKEVIFLYEPLIEGCVVGKKIWLFT